MKFMSAYSFLGEVSSLNAKQWFLQILRSICCKKCMSCDVVVDSDFPVGTKARRNLFLKMTCFGMYFFEHDRSENREVDTILKIVLAIDYFKLGDCKLQKNEFSVKAVLKGKMREFKLKTKEAPKIKSVLDLHSNARQRENFSKFYETELVGRRVALRNDDLNVLDPADGMSDETLTSRNREDFNDSISESSHSVKECSEHQATASCSSTSKEYS